MQKDNGRLILASQSASRHAMLERVGLKFESIPAEIDEETLTSALLEKGAKPEAIAAALAMDKALHISAQNPGALVIGADQVLELEGKLISKAADAIEAQQKLKQLRGKTHRLVSAVCVALDGKPVWQHYDEARLVMRDVNDQILAAYCAAAGPALTRSVGAYELEGIGAWLFERVEGDFFTILGLPLLPLLGYLQHE
jgi:septum formation protein